MRILPQLLIIYEKWENFNSFTVLLVFTVIICIFHFKKSNLTFLVLRWVQLYTSIIYHDKLSRGCTSKYWFGFILKRFVFMSWLILLYVVQSIKRLMIVWFLSSLLASDGSVPDLISISSAPKFHYKSAINGKFLVKIHMYYKVSLY